MDNPRWEQTRTLTTGMWLAGVGLMLLNGRFWPDLLFLFGSVRLIEGHRHPELRNSRRAGIVLLLLGLLFASRLGLVEILALFAVGLVVSRLLERPTNRKPAVDPSLL